MKKAVIGIMAMTGFLLTGQQISATTLEQTILGHTGALYFDLSGVGSSGSNTSQNPTGETWGVYAVNAVYSSATENSTTRLWTSGLGDTVYGTFFGLYDLAVTGSGNPFTVFQGGPSAGFSLYELAFDLNYNPTGPAGRMGLDGYDDGSHSTADGTKIIEGLFDEVYQYVDPNDGSTKYAQVEQTLTSPASPSATGKGEGYGTVTGGTLFNSLNTGAQIDPFRHMQHDVFFSFHVDNPSSDDTSAGWDQHLYDPAILASQPVPEPATMLLFGTGLVGLAGFGRRKSRK